MQLHSDNVNMMLRVRNNMGTNAIIHFENSIKAGQNALQFYIAHSKDLIDGRELNFPVRVFKARIMIIGKTGCFL